MRRGVRLFLFGVLACSLMAPQAGAQGAPLSPRAYVANQSGATVTVIDIATNTVVATVDLQALGYSATAKPHFTAVEPDGSAWYLTMIGENKVLKFDRANHVVGSVSTPVPGLMALDPVHDRLFIGRSMAAVNPPSSITMVRRSDMTLLDDIDVVVPRPHAITITPDGNHVYVGSLGSNQMAIVNPDDGTARLMDIPGPLHTVVQWAMSPDGRWMAGTGQMTNLLLVYSLADPDHPALTNQVQVGHQPWHPTVSRDGHTVFVPDFADNAVTLVDAGSWTVRRTVTGDVFAQPHGSASSPDGKYIYVSNRNTGGEAHDHDGHPDNPMGRVAVLCESTGDIVATIPAGAYAAGMNTPTTVGVLPSLPACR